MNYIGLSLNNTMNMEDRLKALGIERVDINSPNEQKYFEENKQSLLDYLSQVSFEGYNFTDIQVENFKGLATEEFKARNGLPIGVYIKVELNIPYEAMVPRNTYPSIKKTIKKYYVPGLKGSETQWGHTHFWIEVPFKEWNTWNNKTPFKDITVKIMPKYPEPVYTTDF